MNVLLLGYDWTVFKDAPTAGDTRTRMAGYARRLDELKPGSTLTLMSYSRERLSGIRRGGDNLWFVPAYAPNPHLFLLSGWFQAVHLPKHLWPDVISSQSPFEDAILGLLLGKRFRAKCEVQTHFDLVSPYWLKEHPIINCWRIRLARFCYRRADLVRVPSSRLKREIARQLGIEDGKIRAVIVPSSFAGSAVTGAQRDAVQPDLPGGHSQYVLYLGRLAWEKNIPFLLDVATEVRARRPSVGFVIAGDGPQREFLEREVERRNLHRHVHLLGQVPHQHIGGLLAQANVLILPSYYEGLARVELEAYAAGVPCVSTSVSGADDMILNGETGFIVEVNDLPTFVERLTWLLDHPDEARKMGSRGQQHVLAKYAYERVVDELVRGWIGLVSQK